MTDTTPSPQIWPTLRATDAPALVAFLVEAFGFEETVSYPDDDGGIAHAQLDWPLGGGVMLGSERDDDAGPFGPGVFSCYVVTDDPDALRERALAAGAKLLREVSTTDYGSRDVAFADPEGNRWFFGTYRGHPRRNG
jgi:uncharacterized glyoxalase superfamily protein PhnB